MRVPFHRVVLSDAEIAAATRVLRSGWLTSGEECAAFEREFAAAIGGGVEAIAVNSSTAGMHLALEALGIGPGDEVIVPTVTFTATAEVVSHLGATPVFADVDPHTTCLTAGEIERRITPRTRAVMPVHLGGLACDMAAIGELCRRRNLQIVEDAAHAFPAAHGGTSVGAHGSAATVFSFYASKTITTGEGGMIVSTDRKLLDRARLMRLHGIDGRRADEHTQRRYDVVALGYKYNLTDMAAALGREQLKRAGALHAARTAIAARYDRAFGDLGLGLPARPDTGGVHAHHLYVVQVNDRARFTAHLASKGVGTSVHFTPLHQLSYWRKRYDLKDEDFPHATRYGARCVSLPLFPTMREEDIAIVVDAATSAVR